MTSSIYLFVYGTLLSRGSAATLLDGCERVANARVQGTLYDIDGAYPALVLAGSGGVDGRTGQAALTSTGTLPGRYCATRYCGAMPPDHYAAGRSQRHVRTETTR